MKLKQLLEQLNQLAKERPEALEMSININAPDVGLLEVREISISNTVRKYLMICGKQDNRR